MEGDEIRKSPTIRANVSHQTVTHFIMQQSVNAPLTRPFFLFITSDTQQNQVCLIFCQQNFFNHLTLLGYYGTIITDAHNGNCETPQDHNCQLAGGKLYHVQSYFNDLSALHDCQKLKLVNHVQYILFSEREREYASGEGVEGEGERENPKQTLQTSVTQAPHGVTCYQHSI